MRYDVAIVGAGPAGAWCAQRLAATGARVALIDASHPREKPCGGGVTARALALVGDAGHASEGVPIRSAAFDYEGRRAEVPLGDGESPARLAVFSRREFDRRLLERACSAGATLVRERATDLSRSEAGWTIKTRTGAGDGRVRARWLIGADGANGLVRKRLGRPFRREDLSIACGYFVRGISGNRIDIQFEDSPEGYLWSFPRADHLAVGVCAQADVASVSTLMPVAKRWIQDHVSGGTLERYSWPIPSLSVSALARERPAEDSWLLVGDAAGLVDPITREGIYFALESADAAADSLSGANGSERYRTRLRDNVYPELTLAAQIKERFYRPAFMRLLISALRRSEKIGAIMADLVSGEQAYRTLRSRLLRTMEWRLAAELFLRRG
jgi:geranylgeranyl reductase family protein